MAARRKVLRVAGPTRRRRSMQPRALQVRTRANQRRTRIPGIGRRRRGGGIAPGISPGIVGAGEPGNLPGI